LRCEKLDRIIPSLIYGLLEQYMGCCNIDPPNEGFLVQGARRIQFNATGNHAVSVWATIWRTTVAIFRVGAEQTAKLSQDDQSSKLVCSKLKSIHGAQEKGCWRRDSRCNKSMPGQTIQCEWSANKGLPQPQTFIVQFA